MLTHEPIFRDSFENHSFVVSKRAMNSSLLWSLELEASPGIPNEFSISEGEFGYTIKTTSGFGPWTRKVVKSEQICLFRFGKLGW